MRRLALALILLAVWTTPVAAKEHDRVKDLLAQLGDLRKAEDVGGLKEVIGKVPAVYKAFDKSSSRKKLPGELGKVLKDKDLADVHSAAVAALVALEDPKVAWKELSRFMPDPKTEKAVPLDLEVVKAAGTLAPTRAVKPLTELAFKAKDPALATAGVEALGHYGKDVKGRVKILEELVTVGKRTRPGRSMEKNVSKAAQDRWTAMGPVLINALNTLTGQSISSFEDWEQLWDEYKKRPKQIFVED